MGTGAPPQGESGMPAQIGWAVAPASEERNSPRNAVEPYMTCESTGSTALRPPSPPAVRVHDAPDQVKVPRSCAPPMMRPPRAVEPAPPLNCVIESPSLAAWKTRPSGPAVCAPPAT